jgi:antitoxin HicB
VARYVFPVLLAADDNGTVLVTAPDLPGFVTYGDSEAEALRKAQGALAQLIDACMRTGKPIPEGSPARGRLTIAMPTLMTLKAALYMAMRESKMSKSELARRLGVDVRQVRRMLDPLVSSRVEELDRALALLGKRFEVTIRDAA